MTGHLGGAKIFKRDELNHTGAHKINNVLARSCSPAAWARSASSPRPALASMASPPPRPAPNIPECIVFMGAVDVERQKPNVFRMKMLGAEVRAGAIRRAHAEGRDERGAARLGRPTSTTLYCIGTVAGPHPYPAMVRDFQSIIGRKRASRCWSRGPPAGSAGRLHRRRLQRDRPVPSLPRRQERRDLRRRGGGHGVVDNGHAARSPAAARRAARQPHLSADGRRRPDPEGHSISAGLDYPGIGPEHAWLRDVGRVTYLSATDKEALDAFQLCSQLEGIIPALGAGARARQGDGSSRRNCRATT